MLSFLKGKKRRRGGRSRGGGNNASSKNREIVDSTTTPESSTVDDSTTHDVDNQPIETDFDFKTGESTPISSSYPVVDLNVDESIDANRISSGNNAESSDTCDELEQVLRINPSDDSGADSNGLDVDNRRHGSSTTDLEKSRRAFFLGLLEEETIEEIYPDNVARIEFQIVDGKSGEGIDNSAMSGKRKENVDESGDFEEDESGIGGCSDGTSTSSNPMDDKGAVSVQDEEAIDMQTENDELSLEEFDSCDNLSDKNGTEVDDGDGNRGIVEGRVDDDAKTEGDNERNWESNEGSSGVRVEEGGGAFGTDDNSERRPFAESEVPVSCATSGDEHESTTVEMLTLRNGAFETFPRSNLNLTSSSDESIGGLKVKKHVRWADTDDGRSLESYDSYSSCSSSSSSLASDDDDTDDERVDVDVKDPLDADGLTNSQPDEDSNVESEDDSESGPDSNSDDEEDKTGAEDTLTVSDITVINSDESQKDIVVPEECPQDETENTETENKTEQDLIEIVARLQNELLTKAANLEKAQSDLDAAVLEADQARKKIERLKEELDELKRRHNALQNLHDEGNFANEEKNRLECRIKELEEEVQLTKSDKNRLEAQLTALERERDHEIHLVQQALEEALKEKVTRETRYQKEFEAERTLTSQRELQMLEDFEWKLRETEKNAKKKMESAEAEATKRVHEMESRLARAEADLEKLSELQLCEIELKQLKATSSEQRRNLRQVTRQYEELQVNEKILQEEVNRLRVALDKEKQTIIHLQTLHKEESAEKDRKFRIKLEAQCSQITSEWEDRLRQELSKLKEDLENTHKEEKIVAVDMVKVLKEQEISSLRQGWEEKVDNLKQQIATLKVKLGASETLRKQEIESVQTSSDRDAMDLRRKMDKLDMEYQSKIEKMQEEHETELSEIKQEYEKKIVQIEAASQLQAGTTRTTIELVKQQLINENQSRIERLMANHRQQMEDQWEALEKDRLNEVRALEDRHREALEHLRLELDEIRKVGSSPTNTQSVIGTFFRYFTQAVNPSGKQTGRSRVSIPATSKQLALDQGNHETANPLSGGVLEGIEGISAGSDAEKILFVKLQQMVHQSNEDKAEIERLRSLIEQKEAGKQQQQPLYPNQPKQQPAHPSRRNRKRRN